MTKESSQLILDLFFPIVREIPTLLDIRGSFGGKAISILTDLRGTWSVLSENTRPTLKQAGTLVYQAL